MTMRTRSSLPFGRPLVSPTWDPAVEQLRALVDERITQRTQVGLATRVRGCSGRHEYAILDATSCGAQSPQDVTLAVRTDGLTYPVNWDPGPGLGVAGVSVTSETVGSTTDTREIDIAIVRTMDPAPEGTPLESRTYTCHGYDAITGRYIGPWATVILPGLLRAIADGYVWTGPVDGEGNPACVDPDPVNAIRWGLSPERGEG